jgi:peptide/nickel transport system ATP-binding protein
VPEQPVVLQAQQLRKWYPVPRGLLGKAQLKAVDGVDLTIHRGEIFGLLGESGCGKSTLGRLLIRLETATEGRITFHGEDVTHRAGKALKPFRRRAQIMFQNPFETFDGRYSIASSLGAPLRIHNIGLPAERERLMEQVLRQAKLEPPDKYLSRYPHELSGGQLQRVALTRAMLLEPDFIVADEPVSMLDVSVRAEVLNMLLDLRAERGTAFLFITHDIAVARYVCDRIAVMYLGVVVEEGPAEEIVRNPRHPYTQALVSSAPSADPRRRKEPPVISGDVPTPIDPPDGCRFAGRCPHVMERCRTVTPVLKSVEVGHLVACHLNDEGGKSVGEAV